MRTCSRWPSSHADPVPPAGRDRALVPPAARASRRLQRHRLLRGQDVPRLRRRQRPGRRVAVGGRQRARADHRRPAATDRLPAALDRAPARRAGRGDRQDLPLAGDGDVPQIFTGHGLSTNVVEASLQACLAAVNKLIADHPVAADAIAAGAERRSAPTRPPRGALVRATPSPTCRATGSAPRCATSRGAASTTSGVRFGFDAT